ncbi:MAG: class I SAM-dependent methyltransferase [Candidatus Bathyarchaeota archaeon]|nr:class I SAM-dependent methyltransferase [Candidatus Bathyarchaeota archaeon]
MSLPTKRVYFGDYVFFVDENVYEPAEDSFIFAENLAVTDCECVLDMGTGCGILGIIASKKARKVVAVDVNPYAVRCAKYNSKVNNVESKIAIIQSDLFTWLSEKAKFDLILFNAPYLPEEIRKAQCWLDYAWAGGLTGREIIDRFISEAPKHLKSSGRILLMQSTLANVNGSICKFAEFNMRTRILAKHDLPFFETLFLLEAYFDEEF